jgi:hypothetical protein
MACWHLSVPTYTAHWGSSTNNYAAVLLTHQVVLCLLLRWQHAVLVHVVQEQVLLLAAEVGHLVLLYKGLSVLQAAAGRLWEAEQAAVKVTGMQLRQLLQHAQHVCLCVAACCNGTERQLVQLR